VATKRSAGGSPRRPPSLPNSAFSECNGTRRCATSRVPRPAPLHHRADKVQMKPGLSSLADEIRGSAQLMLEERGREDTPGSCIWANNRHRSFVTKQRLRLPAAAVKQSKREHLHRSGAYRAKLYHCGARLSRRRSIDRTAGCAG